MSGQGCWPEQEAVWKWMKDYGIKLTFEQESALKEAVSAPRIEADRRIAELEAQVKQAGAEERVFVGYTNGAQILYANDEAYGGEGNFYINTDDDCCIPLYMLRIHGHRLDSTTGGQVTLERVEGLQSEARRLRDGGAP